MKRFSTLLISALCVVVSAATAFGVYAAVTNTRITASNRVMFQASDDIFYTADMTVKYSNSGKAITIDNINHSGEGSAHNPTKTQMEIADDLLLSTTDNKISYTFLIKNYSQFAISVTIQPNQDNQDYLSHTIEGLNPQTNLAILQARTLGQQPPYVEVRITTELITFKNSIRLDNTFNVVIDKI